MTVSNGPKIGRNDPGTVRDDFEAQLLAFIRDRLLPDAGLPLAADTYLFADGLINSMRILDLVAFVESSLGIEVRLADVTMSHFRSVRAIADYFVLGLDESSDTGRQER